MFRLPCTYVVGFTESSDESSSSDSSDSDSGEERDDSEGVSVVEWRPKGPQQALGEWEKHTTVSIPVQRAPV